MNQTFIRECGKLALVNCSKVSPNWAIYIQAQTPTLTIPQILQPSSLIFVSLLSGTQDRHFISIAAKSSERCHSERPNVPPPPSTKWRSPPTSETEQVGELSVVRTRLYSLPLHPLIDEFYPDLFVCLQGRTACT